MELVQQRPRPRRSHRRVMRTGVCAGVLLATVGLAACSDDSSDDGDAPSPGTVVVDEDFPGDALDATCARLEAVDGDDQDAIAAALLDELIGLGDAELAVNTMELAVIDRCPEWADAVAAAVDARS